MSYDEYVEKYNTQFPDGKFILSESQFSQIKEGTTNAYEVYKNICEQEDETILPESEFWANLNYMMGFLDGRRSQNNDSGRIYER